MHAKSENENENLVQGMTNRNWEEMRQQTLDALKVVQSFEAKPARSARVQELLAQKTQARQFTPALRKTAVPNPPAAEQPPRQALQPITETSSPEKRFAGSPHKVSSANASPVQSPLRFKGDRVREASPVKNLFAKRMRQTTSQQEKSIPSRPTAPMERFQNAPTRSLIHQELSLSRPSGPPQNVKPSSRAVPGAGSFRSVSRLLQPTAASAAKMRPVRAPIAPVKNDRLHPRPDSIARPMSATTSTVRPSALTRPQSSLASSAVHNTRPNLLSLGSKPQQQQQPRMAGMSQLSGNRTLSKAHVQTLPRSSSSARNTTQLSQQNMAATGPQTISSVQPHKSLLSSVLTKTHVDKQPSNRIEPSQMGFLATPNTAKVTAQPKLTPVLPGLVESPIVTSTPVRSGSNTSASEHSSGSLQSFDFTNFSFEADWANTPELRRKVLDQQHEDTLQLFGRMPPINLESIFGPEMKRQGR